MIKENSNNDLIKSDVVDVRRYMTEIGENEYTANYIITDKFNNKFELNRSEFTSLMGQQTK